MNVTPYLTLNGRCEEAINFYKAELGAEVLALLRFKENPPPADRVPANWDNKVMHSCFKIGDTQIMATDGDRDDDADEEERQQELPRREIHDGGRSRHAGDLVSARWCPARQLAR